MPAVEKIVLHKIKKIQSKLQKNNCHLQVFSKWLNIESIKNSMLFTESNTCLITFYPMYGDIVSNSLVTYIP